MKTEVNSKKRVQIPSITDEEIETMVANCKKSSSADSVAKKDYLKAYEIVVKTQRASISHLQRRMGIGYNRAAALIDELEANGVIGAQTGSGPRKILVDTLPDTQMAEVDMTIRLSFKELKALLLLANERQCDVGDIASEFVHEGLVKKDKEGKPVRRRKTSKGSSSRSLARYRA